MGCADSKHNGASEDHDRAVRAGRPGSRSDSQSRSGGLSSAELSRHAVAQAQLYPPSTDFTQSRSCSTEVQSRGSPSQPPPYVPSRRIKTQQETTSSSPVQPSSSSEQQPGTPTTRSQRRSEPEDEEQPAIYIISRQGQANRPPTRTEASSAMVRTTGPLRSQRRLNAAAMIPPPQPNLHSQAGPSRELQPDLPPHEADEDPLPSASMAERQPNNNPAAHRGPTPPAKQESNAQYLVRMADTARKSILSIRARSKPPHTASTGKRFRPYFPAAVEFARSEAANSPPEAQAPAGWTNQDYHDGKANTAAVVAREKKDERRQFSDWRRGSSRAGGEAGPLSPASTTGARRTSPSRRRNDDAAAVAAAVAAGSNRPRASGRVAAIPSSSSSSYPTSSSSSSSSSSFSAAAAAAAAVSAARKLSTARGRDEAGPSRSREQDPVEERNGSWTKRPLGLARGCRSTGHLLLPSARCGDQLCVCRVGCADPSCRICVSMLGFALSPGNIREH